MSTSKWVLFALALSLGVNWALFVLVTCTPPAQPCECEDDRAVAAEVLRMHMQVCAKLDLSTTEQRNACIFEAIK